MTAVDTRVVVLLVEYVTLTRERRERIRSRDRITASLLLVLAALAAVAWRMSEPVILGAGFVASVAFREWHREHEDWLIKAQARVARWVVPRVRELSIAGWVALDWEFGSRTGVEWGSRTLAVNVCVYCCVPAVMVLVFLMSPGVSFWGGSATVISNGWAMLWLGSDLVRTADLQRRPR